MQYKTEHDTSVKLLRKSKLSNKCEEIVNTNKDKIDVYTAIKMNLLKNIAKL